MPDPKTILINPPSISVEDDRVAPSLGLLYVASTLIKEFSDNISIADLSGCSNLAEIKTKINELPEANVYGITSFCTNYNFAKQIIQRIKEKFKHAYVIFGGPHASSIPEETLLDSKADVVITGEGEDSFLECIKSYSENNRILGIKSATPRLEIDSYEFPARQLVDYTTYSRKLFGNPVVCLLASRGCKNKCLHCNSIVMGGGSRHVRYRSPENIVTEILSLRDKYQYFRFDDDHFTGHPQLEKLLVQLKNLDINFRVFARIEDLNQKNCILLQQAGCRHVTIGIESLNPKNLKIIGKKEQIGYEKNVKIAKDNGIVTRSSFIVGLPFDTDDSINTYFNKAALIGIDEFAIYPLIPYPGTRIWKYPEKFGYRIIDSDYTKYVQMGKKGKTCFALEHHNFSAMDVRRWLEEAGDILTKHGAIHMRESKVT